MSNFFIILTTVLVITTLHIYQPTALILED